MTTTKYPTVEAKRSRKKKVEIPYQTYLNLRLEVVRENPVEYIQVRCAEDTANAFHEEALKYPNEVFKCIHLNGKNFILGVETISVGSISSTYIHPREVYKGACVNNARSVIFFHNHPSGDPTPSKDDIDITQRLKQCGLILGISVLDHMIFGDKDRYFSFVDQHIL